MSQHCTSMARCTSIRLYQSCCTNKPPVKCHYRGSFSKNTVFSSTKSIVPKNVCRASSSNPVHSALHRQTKQSTNETEQTYHDSTDDSNAYQSQPISIIAPNQRNLSASKLPFNAMPIKSARGKDSYFSNIRQSMNSNFNANLSTSTATQSQLNPFPQSNSLPDENEAFYSEEEIPSTNGNGNGRKSHLWTSTLTKSINWFYNQSAIDAAASKVSVWSFT